MNLLFSCVGKRGYIVDYFRASLPEGSKLYGTSNTRWTPGFRSCDGGILLPDIGSPEHMPALLAACEEHDIKAVLSFFDPDVAELAKHKDALKAAGVTAIVPDAPCAALCFDKWTTFEALRDRGFLVPETWLDLAEAEQALDEGRLSFPLFVKPRYGFGSANTFHARNRAQLAVFHAYEDDMLIQAALPGEAFNIEALADFDGKVLSVVPWRKDLSRLGETERAYTVDDRRLVDFGVRLAEKIGLIGPMDVDLFVDGDDIWVLEINPRFGGGYPVSHHAGARFPEMLVALLQGESVEPRLGDYRAGVAMMKEVKPYGGPMEDLLR